MSKSTIPKLKLSIFNFFVCFLLFSTSVFNQVHIKERVEINSNSLNKQMVSGDLINQFRDIFKQISAENIPEISADSLSSFQLPLHGNGVFLSSVLLCRSKTGVSIQPGTLLDDLNMTMNIENGIYLREIPIKCDTIPLNTEFEGYAPEYCATSYSILKSGYYLVNDTPIYLFGDIEDTEIVQIDFENHINDSWDKQWINPYYTLMIINFWNSALNIAFNQNLDIHVTHPAGAIALYYYEDYGTVCTNNYGRQVEGYMDQWVLLIFEKGPPAYSLLLEPAKEYINKGDSVMIKVTAIDSLGNEIPVATNDSVQFDVFTFGCHFEGGLNSIMVDYQSAHSDSVRLYTNNFWSGGSDTSAIWVQARLLSDSTMMGHKKIYAMQNNFALDLEPARNKVHIGDSIKIRITAKDSLGNEKEVDENTRIIVTASPVGHFTNCDTLTITYGIAHNDSITFYAPDSLQDSLQTLQTQIKAKVIVDSTITGYCAIDVFILEFNLSLPDTTVWPTLRSNDGGNPNHNNILQNISAEIIEAGTPLQNQEITASLEMIIGSGGHDHNGHDNPPTTTRSLGGFSTGTNTNSRDTSFTASTDGNGQITFNYLAGNAGCEMIIKVRTEYNDSTFFARDTIIIKVPDLDSLHASTYYDLIGGTCDHHGPSDKTWVNDSCKVIDNNHWGTRNTLDNIDSVALDWHQNFPNEEILQINDISLKNGGWFDNGEWNGNSHSSHRIGTDIDIRTELPPGVSQGYPNGRNGVNIRNPRNSINLNAIVGNEVFERICRYRGGTAAIHGTRGTSSEHYHIDF